MLDNKIGANMKKVGNSKSIILDRMAEGSVASQWDAVLHYNRSMANQVLVQDYVNQFSNESWYEPINYTAHLKGTENRLDFVDVVLSEPLISFVSQEIYLKPTLRVTWFAKSGTIISSHGDDIRYENILNPMMGPTLVALIPVSSGVVEEGKVYLDISDATDFIFNFSEVGDESTQVGKQLQEYLKQVLSGEHQRILISEIANVDGSIWNPESFKIDVRLPPALRGTRMLDDEVNDGAVVVSVALEGSSPGGVAVDPIYMIPDDGDFTAAIVISNKTLMKNILQKGVAKMGNSPVGDSALEAIQPATKEFFMLRATAGGVAVSVDLDWPVEDLSFGIPSISLAKSASNKAEARFTCSIDKCRVLIEWNAFETFNVNHGTSLYPVELNWKKKLLGEFVTVGDTEISLSVKDDIYGGMLLAPVFDVDNQMPYAVTDLWDEISDLFFKGGVEKAIDSALRRFAQHVPDFNTFVLQNILFKANDIVSLKEVYTPGDLVAFGNIRPALTAIQVTDPMPKVLKGQTYQFIINSSVGTENLKWTVEPLADSKGLMALDFGSINERTGLYTAPSEVGGDGFLQVKVTVIDEPTQAKCFALLSVFHQSILVSPEFFKVSFDSQFPVRAVAHDKSLLTPVLPTDTDGKIAPSETEMNVWIYSPGPRPAPTVGYKLERIEFESEGNGSTGTAVALCLASGLILMNYDVCDVPGTYEFYGVSSGSGNKKKGKWELLDGPGAIDADTGIYTCDPQEPEPTIILHGLFNDGEDIGVDVFKLDPTGKSLATLIRRGEHPSHKNIKSDKVL
ncbi:MULTISPECIES: hypothetical protein [unclassified Pseudomonas]|uniref:hypothetical protein n=1 Tax=unclassified Pseudomonas TaxID=196821 RepID=UPI001473AD60|nr:MULTISPECIES: hypothetical protein [unclassified Pseudomonas]NMY39640.1 hypothetical protein [Pseudomonas sp. WS 5078]NMY62383.1 hypothetical protein [Pseudomonas sp. WS 5354]